MMNASDIAREYLRRGWSPIPVPFRSKRPNTPDWQHLALEDPDIEQAFAGEKNIGVLLGPKSAGLTDVDLDCREAVELAPHFIERTGAIFGRASHPDSHWLYQTTLSTSIPQSVIAFRDPMRPKEKGMLVEIRIGGETGAQTVFPGSVHESGEPIEWSEKGEPARLANEKLLRDVATLASACLFARYWPAQGGRHKAALGLGGFLSRADYQPAQIKYFVEAIARAAGDTEPGDRKRAAEDAAVAHRTGKRAAGFPQIKELFGEPVAKRVAEWLNYTGSSSEPPDENIGVGRRAPPNDIVTEDNAAERFVELHGDDLRFCHSQGVWYRWNGSVWVREQKGLAFHFARGLARELAKNQDERKRYVTSKTSFASGVERFAKSDPRVAVTAEDWDHDPFLLGTPGGTVDLKTGKLRDSRREDAITKSTSVAPVNEPCTLWLKFLVETTGDDGELIRFLQQWCGYALTGSTRELALVFVYGPGGNGKSVFLNIVAAILKDYAATAAMDTFTASKSDKHPTDLAMLRGARLVTASETEEGRSWAESRIKQLTGGDRISARFMRQDFFEYTPQFKLMIAGNHKPVLHSPTPVQHRAVSPEASGAGPGVGGQTYA